MTGALKSKTMWMNAIVAVLGVLEMQGGLVKEMVGAEHFGTVMILIACLGAALRVVTTTSLANK